MEFLNASMNYYFFTIIILLQKNLLLFVISLYAIFYIKKFGYGIWNFILITIIGAFTVYELSHIGLTNNKSIYAMALYASYFICYSIVILYLFFILKNLNIIFAFIFEQITSTLRGIRDIILIVIWQTPKAILIFLFIYLLIKPFKWVFKRPAKQNNLMTIKKSSNKSLWKFTISILLFTWRWFIIFPFKLLFVDDNKKIKKFTPKGKPIGYGGEAEIYKSGFNTLIKIFHKNQATQLKLDVISKLIDTDLPNFVIKPISVVHDNHGTFIGYEMQKAKGIELEELFFEGGMAKYFPKYTLLDLLDLSITIIDSFTKLHQYSIIAGDISHGNILIQNKFKINIIDTDSFQLNQPNGVGQQLYTRPINFHKSDDKYMKNQSDDAYAIVVLIFRLFHYGYTPYMENDDYKIEDTHFPFKPNDINYSHEVMPEIIKSYHRLPYQLQELFFNIFTLKYSLSLKEIREIILSSKEYFEGKKPKGGLF